MRLKIQLSSFSHSDALIGADWLNADEAISISDDHNIWRWSMAKFEPTPLPSQIKDIFPTSLQFSGNSSIHQPLNTAATTHPHRSSSQKRSHASSASSNANDLLLLTAADGKIHLVNLTGKLEKSIDAHQGAAILARWSNAEPGGAGGFASCGEDGCVKMWSRTGMLRSVLAQLGKPIYALGWNGDSSKLAYSAGEECFIKLLNAQTSPVKWRAHTGLVLCLSWSGVNDQIVTGGEDCRYRLWDGHGRPLWSSASHGFPINSVSWSPNGEMFAVGSFNLLRLCDRTGWSHSLERPNTGSIHCLSWSPDAIQLVAGCANGQLLHAHIVEKLLMWEQLEAVQTRRKTINIRDLSSEVARERLETRDRVIRLELGFNFLVVATTKQCYIFSSKNWNTPVVTDLKEGSGMVSLIRLCEKCFLLVDASSVQVWNYEGRILSTIRLPSTGVAGEPLNEQTAAIANDLVALRDRAQHNIVHLFDPVTGRTAGDGQITHSVGIVELCVNQCGGMADRRVAFVDVNGDCFLALVNCYGASQRCVKIGALISCLTANNTSNQLAAFQNSQQLIIWTLPTVAFLDRDLLSLTQLKLGNGAELGKFSLIVGFIANTVTVRRSDGCLITHYVPPFIAALIRCAQHSRWDQAVRICRAIKEEFLWATLAGLAVGEKNFTVAEICYGQLGEAEKVLFLSELRAQPNAQLKAAQMAEFGGHLRETEAALVKAGRLFRAIMLNVGVFRFGRALELALKSGTHLDSVLGYRQRYLDLLGRKEKDPKFLKHLSQVEIDWPHIFERIREDEDKDQRQWATAAAGGGPAALTSPN